MDVAVNQIDFNVALNALQDEVFARLQQVNVLQIEFLRQFQCHLIAPETHPALVYSIRKILAVIEDVYQGVKGYFIDLKMEVAFQLFRKMQIIMVNGYNFLAKTLLSHIDKSEETKIIKENQKNREALLMKHQHQKLKLSHSPSRKPQNCDYTIGFIESQEAKITEQMHKIQERLLLSRQLIQKLVPSKAVKQLTEIKEQAQITLQNTQKIFEQTYKLKYIQFKNHLSQMLKPEDIANEFCENVKNALHDRFTNGVKKSFNVLQEMMKNEKAMLMRQASVQTDDVQIKCEKKPNVSKNTEKMQNLLLKERKLNEKLSANLQLTKKQLQVCKLDKQRLFNELKQTNTNLAQTKQNYEILTKLYEQKREELMKLEESLGMQAKMIQDLRIFEWRYRNKQSKQAQLNIQLQRDSKEIQVNLEDQQQLIAFMRKSMEKMRSRILELELTKQIQDKVLLRRSSRRFSKLSLRQSYESPQTSEASFERNTMRRRSQIKKKTLNGARFLTQKNESSDKFIYQNKKLSIGSNKMQQQIQIIAKQQTKKRQNSRRLSKFVLDAGAAKNILKGIGQIQIIQRPYQQRECRNIATQTTETIKDNEQRNQKADKYIQTSLAVGYQNDSKQIIQKKKRQSEYPKSFNLTTRQKSNDFKIFQSQTKANLKIKQKKQIQQSKLKLRKQKTFQKKAEDNLLEMQSSMLKNSTVRNKHHFQTLNIEDQEKTAIKKRSIMEKSRKYLLNHKPKISQKQNVKSLIFQEKCAETASNQGKASQRKKCLFNIGKIQLQRSLDLGTNKATYKLHQTHTEVSKQQNDQ